MRTWLKKEKDTVLVFLFLFIVYLVFQSNSIYGGDSGDLVAAAASGTFPHPPGYPLYTMLSRILLLLPFNTPAWRVALLSSFFSALSMALWYVLLNKYFNRLISFTTALFTAFLYPVFLYSCVPEVFALNTFFTISLIYFSLLWRERPKSIYLYNLALLLGLSFAHHHTVIFCLPVVYWLVRKRTRQLKGRKLVTAALCLFFGLSFYFYLPISSFWHPGLYYWGNAATLKGFFWILLRQGYGTFQAFSGIGEKPLHRFLNLYFFGRYFLFQYQAIAVTLTTGGLVAWIVSLVRRRSNDRTTILITSMLGLLLSYLFLIFYASFPLVGDFQVATVERFFIMPLIWLSVFMAAAIKSIWRWLKHLSNSKIKLAALLLFKIIVVLLPITSFTHSFRQIWLLKYDQTAENLGRDVLRDVAEDGILFLNSDKVVFNTAYVHHALSYRPDLIMIRTYFLNDNLYRKLIAVFRPETVFDNTSNLSPTSQGEVFINNNIDNYPLYSTDDFNYKGFTAVPEGLLLRYYRNEATPSAETVFNTNLAITNHFQDINAQTAVFSRNLFTGTVKEVYSAAYDNIAQYFLSRKQWHMADYFVDKLGQLTGEDDPLFLLYKGEASLGQKKCEQAEKTFLELKQKMTESPLPDAFLRKTYLECFEDDERAKQYLNECIEKDKNNQVKLDDF